MSALFRPGCRAAAVLVSLLSPSLLAVPAAVPAALLGGPLTSAPPAVARAAGSRAAAPAAAAGERDQLAEQLLAQALPDARPAKGRELFAAVLASDSFLRSAVGPFDLAVLVADGLGKTREAQKVLDRAAMGLKPAADALAATFVGEDGVVSGRRFPVVLVSSDPGKDDELAFARVLALLDLCEDGDFSGFKPDLQVFTADNRRAAEVFTWEVLVCNVGHDSIAQHDKLWFDHGIGYAALNLLVNRLFAKGGWGPPPPWLVNGLVDELDIAAYEEAWVAEGESTSWSVKTEGWHREGWEGFVPEGQQPPPPVKGPPPGLQPKLQQTVVSDKWMARAKSSERHWTELAKDLDSDVPASLAHMAAGRTFEKRDRAYARCVLHLLMAMAPDGSESLLTGLDHESRIGTGGMRTGDPLPLIVARALGGVPEVEALEALSMGEFIEAIERPELRSRVVALGGEPLLGVADHRQQSAALSKLVLDERPRQSLYLLIVEIENYRQLQQWELIGEVLDGATRAALSSLKRFPTKERDVEKVAEAFQEALVRPS